MNDTLENTVASYASDRPLYESFSKKLDQLLRHILDASQIKYQVIESRAKTVDSFRDKISRVGKNYKNPMEEIPDLCGCRIIVHYADEVGKFADIIKSEFSILEEELSHQPDAFDADRFGYLSVHYVVRLKAERACLAEWSSAASLHAEIQIRTIIQHAWSAVSHALQYKQETAIPSKLRRRLFRIAGLFKLADEEFVGIRDQRKSLSNKAAEELYRGNRDIRLSYASILQMLNTWDRREAVKTAAEKAHFNVRPYSDDEEHNVIAEIFELAEWAGLHSVSELEEAIKHTDVSVIKRAARAQESKRGWSLSLDFMMFFMLLDKYRDYDPAKSMLEHGWDEEMVTDLIREIRV